MATCWQCKKSSPFLRVGSKSGLCADCLEIANDSAINMITMIKRGGSSRKKVLDMLDVEFAKDFAEYIKEPLSHSRFTAWPASEHGTPAQIERLRRAADVKIASYDKESGIATVKGSTEEPYSVTLVSCTCGDYTRRGLPCKHIYRVAINHGDIDLLTLLKKFETEC